MSRVTCQEWHVKRDMLRITCHSRHVESDMSRVPCKNKHVKNDMLRLICQEWHVDSDMASGSRLATFHHPSMPLLFNVLTFLGVSSWTFMLSDGPFEYWSRLVTGNHPYQCQRVSGWFIEIWVIKRSFASIVCLMIFRSESSSRSHRCRSVCLSTILILAA